MSAEFVKEQKNAELALPGNSIFKNVEIRTVKGLYVLKKLNGSHSIYVLSL